MAFQWYSSGEFNRQAQQAASSGGEPPSATPKKKKKQFEWYNSAESNRLAQQESRTSADMVKEQAKQPTTAKINVGGKDIEIDEQTKKSWFTLSEEAKKALKDRLGEETFNQLKSTLDKEAPKQGIFDKIKDVVDPNSAADIYRRQQANDKINAENKDVPQMLRKPLSDPSQYVSGVQGVGKIAKGIGGAFTSQAVVPIDAY